MKILQSNRAEGYIDTVVCVMAAMRVIVLALNVFRFLTLKQDLDYFAKELIDTATIHGRTSNEAPERYDELCAELRIRPTVSFTGTQYYNSATGKVQLGDTICVQVTYRTYLQGFGAFRIPITLIARHTGLSQKYWK